MQAIDNILDSVERELISAYAVLDSWLDMERGSFEDGIEEPGSSLHELLDQALQSNDSLLYLVQRGRGFVAAATGGITIDLSDEDWFTPSKRPCPKALAGHRQLSLVDRLRRAFRRQLGDGLHQVDLLKRNTEACESDDPIVNLMELDVYQYLHFIALQTRGVVVKLEEEAGGLATRMPAL